MSDDKRLLEAAGKLRKSISFAYISESAVFAFIKEWDEAQEMEATTKCLRCDGCGKIADSEDGEPWTVWTDLPLSSSAAVLMGLVKPINCPECGGSGNA